MTGVRAKSAAGAALLVAAAAMSCSTALAAAMTETPAPGSVRLEPIRVPDPAGGAPWGVRTFRTGDETCAQIGRIVDGQLGTVDEHDVLTPAPYRAEDCGPLDGSGAYPGSYGFGSVQTNAPADCTLGIPGPLNPHPVCPPGSTRTIFSSHLGSTLAAATIANADGSDRRPLPIGPRGDFLAVTDADYTQTTVPRISLRFNGGCTKLGKRMLRAWGDLQLKGCTLYVADLFGPHPTQESDASKAARRNPSAPMKVTAAPQPGVHARVFFLVRFRAPITIEPGDTYVYHVRGPGHYPVCNGTLDQSSPPWPLYSDYATVRGHMTTLLVQPTNPADHRRFCPGRFTVDVSFASNGIVSPPFGRASINVPAVPETHR